jgi:bifunctional DNA-binding transcriptional regulator/antitoxin component of YhaV-PrlF toxin-antitoxin module
MPKSKTDVIKANGAILVLETVIGQDYRITIPTQVRKSVDVKAKVRVTIEKI